MAGYNRTLDDTNYVNYIHQMMVNKVEESASQGFCSVECPITNQYEGYRESLYPNTIQSKNTLRKNMPLDDDISACSFNYMKNETVQNESINDIFNQNGKSVDKMVKVLGQIFDIDDKKETNGQDCNCEDEGKGKHKGKNIEDVDRTGATSEVTNYMDHVSKNNGTKEKNVSIVKEEKEIYLPIKIKSVTHEKEDCKGNIYCKSSKFNDKKAKYEEVYILELKSESDSDTDFDSDDVTTFGAILPASETADNEQSSSHLESAKDLTLELHPSGDPDTCSMDVEDEPTIKAHKSMRAKHKSKKVVKHVPPKGAHNTVDHASCVEEYGGSESCESHKMPYPGQKPFTCDICRQAFQNADHLTIHRRHDHNWKEKKCTCLMCGKMVANVGSVASPTGDRPYICRHCGNAYKEYSIMEAHIQSQHLKPRNIQCNYCDQKFSRTNEKREHMNYEHPDHIKKAKASPFQCDKCEYITNNKNYLANHLKSHIKERLKLECQRCNATFKHRTQLYRHLRTKHKRDKMIGPEKKDNITKKDATDVAEYPSQNIPQKLKMETKKEKGVVKLTKHDLYPVRRSLRIIKKEWPEGEFQIIGCHVKHLWETEDGIKHWYNGRVVAQQNPEKLPTDEDAIFDVEYEEKNVEGSWIYHVENLYQDWKEGSLVILD